MSSHEIVLDDGPASVLVRRWDVKAVLSLSIGSDETLTICDDEGNLIGQTGTTRDGLMAARLVAHRRAIYWAKARVKAILMEKGQNEAHVAELHKALDEIRPLPKDGDDGD